MSYRIRVTQGNQKAPPVLKRCKREEDRSKRSKWCQ